MLPDLEASTAGGSEPVSPAAGASAGKKLLLIGARALVSACLLGFLLSRIDVDSLLSIGRRLSPWFFVMLPALFVCTTLLGSWRWRFLLACHGLRQSVARGAYLYLVGYFFNNFLPTSMGGDIMRGFESSKRIGNKGKVFGSIVVERLLGLLAAITSALVFLPLSRAPRTLAGIVLILNAASWAGAIVLFALLRTSAPDVLLRKLPGAAHRILVRILDTLREFTRHPDLVFKSFCVSFLYQASLVVLYWTCARLAGINALAVQDYLVFIPVVWVIVLAPVSLNSLGVSEVSFSYFFALFGAPKEQGVMVSLMFLSTTMIASIIGGILWGGSSYGGRKTDGG